MSKPDANCQTFWQRNPRKCWGECSVDGSCQGRIVGVLVGDPPERKSSHCFQSLPFWYCQTAIETDESRGFVVEVVEP